MTPKTKEINDFLIDGYVPELVKQAKIEKLTGTEEITEYMQAFLVEVLKRKDELSAECELNLVKQQ